MQDLAVLILCPPNMTAPKNGPNGFLGDRIHQLSAVALATHLYARVYVWPEDAITSQVFQSLSVTFLQGQEIEDLVAEARSLDISRIVGLHADPSSTLPAREKDCAAVKKGYEMAQKVMPNSLALPTALDPRGRVPLWRRLITAVEPEVLSDLRWPSPPFLVASTEAQGWAGELLQQADGRPMLIVSPLAGGPKSTVADEWWYELTQLFMHGMIFVPVHDAEVEKAQSLFRGAQNVVVIPADIQQTAALAAAEGVHVLGIDGGRMNVLAAASRSGVLALYGDWPASAWAMPGVVARTPDMTPAEALMTTP